MVMAKWNWLRVLSILGILIVSPLTLTSHGTFAANDACAQADGDGDEGCDEEQALMADGDGDGDGSFECGDRTCCAKPEKVCPYYSCKQVEKQTVSIDPVTGEQTILITFERVCTEKTVPNYYPLNGPGQCPTGDGGPS